MARERKAFVPFDRMWCPITGEVQGSVPGIKRRVKMKWPDQYAGVDWPPTRTVAGLTATMEGMTAEAVDAIAARYGLGADVSLEEIATAAGADVSLEENGTS